MKDNLTEVTRQVQAGGDERAVAKHLKKGKLLARQRIDKLLDDFSPFLEISPLAAYKCYEPDNVPSAGIVAGIGKVCDTVCMIVANDATVKGGTYYPLTVKKHLRYTFFSFEKTHWVVFLGLPRSSTTSH